MDLIVGATGYLGSEIGQILSSIGRSVRGLYRKNSTAGMIRKLKENSIELVEGDLRDINSLYRACRGVKTIISTATAIHSLNGEDNFESVDYFGHLNLVEAAIDAGVQRFIFFSYPEMLQGPDPASRAKRLIEKRLKDSGLNYTILRPSYLMEFWLCPAMGFNYPNGKVTIFGSGENEVNWLSLSDVAQFTIRCIDCPSYWDKTIDLVGENPLSLVDVVQIFETMSARPFDRQYIPIDTLQEQIAIELDPHQQAYLAMLIAYTRNNPDPRPSSNRIVVDQKVSVREYAKKMLSLIYPVSAQLTSLIGDNVPVRLY